MTILKTLVAILSVWLLHLTTRIPGAEACTVKRNESALEGIVSGDVATCTSTNTCRGSTITDCRKVVCETGTTPSQEGACQEATITNSTTVLCTGYLSCLKLRTSNVKKVACEGSFACYGATLEATSGLVDCRGGVNSCNGNDRVQKMSVTAGCLLCRENSCAGPNFTFTDTNTDVAVNVIVGEEKKHGLSCSHIACQGILRCGWAWLVGLFI